jgi:hypothetical protein
MCTTYQRCRRELCSHGLEEQWLTRACVDAVAREDDAEMATENAVAALGKLLEAHAGALAAGAAAQAWGIWLGALPLTEDRVEAKVVHAQLVRLLEASDPRCAPLSPGKHCSQRQNFTMRCSARMRRDAGGGSGPSL